MGKKAKIQDDTEDFRRALSLSINSGVVLWDEVEGQKWTTDQLAADFDILAFMAPFVVVRLKSTGKKGTVMFRDYPRVYFGWREDQ